MVHWWCIKQTEGIKFQVDEVEFGSYLAFSALYFILCNLLRISGNKWIGRVRKFIVIPWMFGVAHSSQLLPTLPCEVRPIDKVLTGKCGKSFQSSVGHSGGNTHALARRTVTI